MFWFCNGLTTARLRHCKACRTLTRIRQGRRGLRPAEGWTGIWQWGVAAVCEWSWGPAAGEGRAGDARVHAHLQRRRPGLLRPGGQGVLLRQAQGLPGGEASCCLFTYAAVLSRWQSCCT
jgi:hypothetical protein